MINISKDGVLKTLVKNIDVSKISDIFGSLNKDKCEYIVNNLYKRNDILSKVRGELKEEIEKKIKSELSTKRNVMDSDIIKGEKVQNRLIASSIGKVEKVEDKTTLIDTIKGGNSEKIRRLKHKNDEVNRVDDEGKNALMYAIEKDDKELANDILKRYNRFTDSRRKI